VKAEKIYDEKKLIGYVYFYLDYNTEIRDRKVFTEDLTKSLKGNSVGYAGYQKKEYLQNYLSYHLFGDKMPRQIPKYKYNKNKILSIIKRALIASHRELPCEPSRIYVFPNFNSFVRKRMKGIGAFSPCKNAIVIEINPTVIRWEESLLHTIPHEYNHSVYYHYHKTLRLCEGLVMEGYAEHFREKVLGGKRAPWTLAVTEQACKLHFKKLKKKLFSKSSKLYFNVFWE